jgi:protein TonB
MNLRALLIFIASPCLANVALAANQDAKPTFELPAFEIIKLDQVPVAKSRVAAQYPIGMHRAQIEGEVVVDFIVTSEGNVVKAFAAKSSRREFELAAINAVSKWKFAPGLKGGRPVNTHMQVPIVFSLTD